MTAPASLNVVVEGPTDARIIRTVLGRALAEKLRFYAAQGRASLATVGRNLLVHEGGPVLLVWDADTLNPRLSEEMRAMTRAALGGVAPGGLFEVFTFIPEIEVIFFEAPQALESVLGRKIAKEELREGQLVPRATLGRLLPNEKAGGDCQRLLDGMDARAADALARGKQARALREAVESLLALVVSPS